MQKFNTLADAIRLAEFAHFSQVDKAGLPYIKHPMRVLEKVQSQGALPYVQMAAVLHDVTEDTKITTDTLLTMGFPESAVNIVRLLDRGASKNRWISMNESRDRLRDSWANMSDPEYSHEMKLWVDTNFGSMDNIDDPDGFYYYEIKSNPQATLVKLADIEDNLAPWRQSYLSDDTQKRLQTKYAKARRILDPPAVNHGFIG